MTAPLGWLQLKHKPLRLLVALAGCGTESDDATSSKEADATATATGATALDLTDVRFDVRRDPG